MIYESSSIHPDTKTRKRRRYFDKLKKGLIDDIEAIDVKIHMVSLTGEYLYRYLQKHFKKLSKPELNTKRSQHYSYISHQRRKMGTVTVLTSPTQGYIPQCSIFIPNPTQKLLFRLLSKYPSLSVSKAEYTVDLMYPSPKHVRRYFYLLRRYAYFPHVRDIRLYTKHNNFRKSDINMSLYAGPIKIYERGKDEDKVKYEGNKKGWLYDKLDRLRIEVTTDSEILRKQGLRDLKKFIKFLNFKDIFLKRLSFKCFDKSAKKVPSEYEYYKTKDKGHAAAFHAEFKEAHNVYKNPAQHLINVKKLEQFMKLLLREITKYDKKWSNRYKKYKVMLAN